jgi:hypothetical protein
MKRVLATFAALALTGGIALAQSSGGSSTGGASTGSTSASPASPATPGSPITGQTPSASPTPPAPSDMGTTGRAPGTNPANSQDVSRRGNPQDLTTPRGMNPQDSRASTPQIYKPEMGR